MIDRDTGETIARLMAKLRPEWDYPGCLAAVGDVKDRDPLNVTMAAVRLCGTPEAKTPAALRAEGPHWREKVAPSEHRHPPRLDQSCRRHPGEWPDTCRACAGDQLAGDDPDAGAHNPRRTPAMEAAVSTARRGIRAAKGQIEERT